MLVKQEQYGQIEKELGSILTGEQDELARMATIACLLKQSFEAFLWVGFYRVDPAKPRELVIGPYQGSLGCLRIPFDKGVCGAAATRRETIIVDDVHEFPGHITCDSRARSEIVVPVLNKKGVLKAVLDIDSAATAAFDHEDRTYLERLVAMVYP